MAKVMIRDASYSNIREAINHVFQLFPMNLQAKSVLIKPNVLRASEAKEGIVTHPAVLRAVVEKVESMNPVSIVVGDNPGLFNYGANEDGFQKTGLMEAAGQYYRNIGDDSMQVDFNPEFMPVVSVSSVVMEADIVISLPKFKTHGLTVLTGAIKNCYGYLPGAQKARLHEMAGNPFRFHEMIVDVCRIRVPDLFIVDAVIGMEGNGPASPDLRNIGVVLASDNAVAVDSVMAQMMGCDPGRIRFLQRAKEVGLGDYDESTIEIIGELNPIPDFQLPPLGGEAIADNEIIRDFIHSRTQVRPRMNPELCTGCATCAEQCPVQALAMDNDLPVADESICITCYCCQEICPEKAITLQ
jgi:uncharacterized protein (DUF362 family)/NAD-dependent dihydropyrimidine dehydrogenase PreA subunit